MPVSAIRSQFDAPALFKGLAIVAFVVGVGVWGAVLLAPAPRKLPPALDTDSVPLRDTAPVAQWFGGAALRVRVAALGLIASDDGRSAALLSIDGGPARAYRAGQLLAPGVTLDAVGSASVFIDQEGTVEEVSVPVSPAGRVRGFVSVPAVSSPQP